MEFLRRILGLLRRRRLEREMAQEMRLHLELEARHYQAAGMAANEARHAAARSFGNVALHQEQAREQRGWLWLDHAFQDARFGWRQLRRSPGFAAMAVLSLGLGIGANTAIFSLVNEMLLQGLPVKNPDELVLFHWWSSHDFNVPVSGDWDTDPQTKQTTCTSFSLRAFRQLEHNPGSLAAVFAFAPLRQPTVVTEGEAEVSSGAQLVSGGYYSGLGINAAAGRLIAPEDDRPGAPAVAVISFGFWQRRYGGEPVVGRTLVLNGAPTTIIGVTPREFQGTLDVGIAPEVTLPLSLLPAVDPWLGPQAGNVGAPWMVCLIGRAKPGFSREQIRSEFEGSFREMARADAAVQSPESAAKARTDPEFGPRLVATPGGKGLNGLRHFYAGKLGTLMGVSGLLLAIACVNVANLLLARGAARRREISARLALGAGRGRLVRQLLTESGLLLGLGAASGVLLAFLLRDVLLGMNLFTSEDGKALALTAPINTPVLLFTAAVSIVFGLAAGIVPALNATRLDLSADFQGGGRNPGGPGRTWLGKSLLVAQITLSLVLLVGAGLFVRTLGNLQASAIGFDRARLLLFGIDALPGGGPDSRAAAQHDGILERISAVPGVTLATYSWMPLLSRAGASSDVIIPGRVAVSGDPASAMVNSIGPGFFPTIGIPVVLGRDFRRSDDAGSLKVAIVNRTLVAKYFAGRNPLGRHFSYHNAPGSAVDVEIIGVVGDFRYNDVRGEMPATFYVPFAQDPWSQATYTIRTAGRPEALAPVVRAAVHAANPTLALADLRTQEEQIGRLVASERTFAQFATWFGGVALLLVCIGLFGLMSYAVTRRTAEIGVRMALGAQPGRLLWMVLREALLLTALGSAIGLAVAWASSRLVAGMLYGVAHTDLQTYGVVSLVLLGAATVAVLLPARRAARVDPVIALRAE